jgi:hypothetical protein
MAHFYRKSIFFTIAMLTIVSCRKKEEETLTTAAPMGKDFDLELIDSVPQTLLDGCGEYLTHDSIKGIAVSYLFVSDLTKYGMIRMDAQNIDLERDSINSRNIDRDQTLQYYRNDSIEVMIRLKAIERYDEGSFNQGILTVTKNRVKKTYKVKGDSGC